MSFHVDVLPLEGDSVQVEVQGTTLVKELKQKSFEQLRLTVEGYELSLSNSILEDDKQLQDYNISAYVEFEVVEKAVQNLESNSGVQAPSTPWDKIYADWRQNSWDDNSMDDYRSRTPRQNSNMHRASSAASGNFYGVNDGETWLNVAAMSILTSNKVQNRLEDFKIGHCGLTRANDTDKCVVVGSQGDVTIFIFPQWGAASKNAYDHFQWYINNGILHFKIEGVKAMQSLAASQSDVNLTWSLSLRLSDNFWTEFMDAEPYEGRIGFTHLKHLYKYPDWSIHNLQGWIFEVGHGFVQIMQHDVLLKILCDDSYWPEPLHNGYWLEIYLATLSLKYKNAKVDALSHVRVISREPYTFGSGSWYKQALP
jgi:hypothetical protein